MVQPDTRAGASFDMVTNWGTFHGTIAATTPTGSLRTMTGEPSTPLRVSSHSQLRPSSRKVLSIIHGAGAWASWLNVMGEPISSVTTWAMSIMRAA